MSSAIDATKPVAGAATTSSVRDNMSAAKTELNDLHRISEDSVTATGTNTIVVTYSPAATGPTSGQLFGFKAFAANTGPATFNPNGLGAVTLESQGVTMAAGEIKAEGQYLVKYDGAKYQLLNPSNRTVNGGLSVTGQIAGIGSFAVNGETPAARASVTDLSTLLAALDAIGLITDDS